MSNFTKVKNWLVYSSVNSTKISLMVKGFLTGLIPFLVFVTGVAHIQFSSDLATHVIDLIAELITAVGGAITALMFVGGLIRKIATTITGENHVINIKNAD